jgi:6-pyruvoyltetrahydropterin/6-carboxytetrahydropterin synthase
MGSYRVHVDRDNLNFAAAHFVSYDNEHIELLHGHNYRLGVQLEGPLDENAYVFNFVTLKRLMKRIADELDHRLLLPTNSRFMTVEPQDDGGVIVRTSDRWYRFPQEDVLILPIPNTTAEMLAYYLCGRLREELAKNPAASHLTAIEVTVQESFGQAAVYRENIVWDSPNRLA